MSWEWDKLTRCGGNTTFLRDVRIHERRAYLLRPASWVCRSPVTGRRQLRSV